MKKLFDEETYDKRLRPYYRGNSRVDPGSFDRRGGRSKFDSENTTETILGKLLLPATHSPQQPTNPSYPIPPSLWLLERKQLWISLAHVEITNYRTSCTHVDAGRTKLLCK